MQRKILLDTEFKKFNPVGYEILQKRYTNGKSLDRFFLDIAKAVASVEPIKKDRDAYTVLFYDMMVNMEFLPSTPVLLNAAKGGNLIACYVLPVEDSIEGIFTSVKNAAVIHKGGGGTGFSFSSLRPAGSKVGESLHGVACGPVEFMEIFDVATSKMKQGGIRRGANMGILRVDHPDILSFIRCKRTERHLENFNLSVAITDEFMEALYDDHVIQLKHPEGGNPISIEASEIWDEIVKGAWENGEPGVLFIDKVNSLNKLYGLEVIEATNPCAEQPLPPWGSCNLGSINLSKFSYDKKKGVISSKRFKDVVELAVRFLDNVISLTEYPLPEILGEALRTRRIGLGIMGLADFFVNHKVRYGSSESLCIAEEVVTELQNFAYEESIRLGGEKGVSPILKDQNLAKPRRNALLTTIAPTGTLSLIAKCSSGAEPIFDYEYDKLLVDGSKIRIVHDALLENKGKREKWMVTAREVSPSEHVKMQSVLQSQIDSGISKTVNLPNDATKKDVDDILRLAYESDCKSITIYREGSRSVEAHSVKSDIPVEIEKIKSVTGVVGVPLYERPELLNGITKRIKITHGNLYVTINRDMAGQMREVFVQLGKSGLEQYALCEAIARLISLALKYNASPAQIIRQLSGIGSDSVTWREGVLLKSIPDAIANCMQSCIDAFENGNLDTSEVVVEQDKITYQKFIKSMLCPECSSPNYIPDGKCLVCMDCGYTKCS